MIQNDFVWEEIAQIEELEEKDCYDLCVLEKDCYKNEPNYIANGFVVHNSGMHHRYSARKKGKEECEIHPLLQDILGNTYGIIIFQEQVMKILNKVGEIPLKDCEILRKAISKKDESKFKKYKEEFIVNGQRVLNWTAEQVENIWKQLELFSTYAFNLSHAISYSFLSSKLLYLKCHYPIEFFCAIIACEEDFVKVKNYINDAKRMGIGVEPVKLNISQEKASIVDEKIYLGILNIKGIGEDPAKRIVELSPYKDFDDFLERYGTDASVVKPLLGLRIFGEDVEDQYRYYLHYKNIKKSREDRKKRYESGCKEREKSLKEYFSEQFWQDLEPNFNNYEEILKRDLTEEQEKWLTDLYKKHTRAVLLYEGKVLKDEAIKDCFDRGKVEIDEKYLEILKSKESSESTYYGFLWDHPLENSPDYSELTFEMVRQEGLTISPVEVIIKEVQKKKSKKDTEYFLLKVEDSFGEEQFIQVWENDWERFSDLLQAGNMLRLRIRIPQGEFSRYTLDSPQKHLRWKLPKKEFDFRVVLMRPKES